MSTDTPDASPAASDNDTSAPADDVVRIQATHDKDGIPTAYAVLTPHSDTRDKEIHCDPRLPIPVIFLPGVMGSLLAHKETGAPLWRAPNLDAIGSAFAGVASVVTGHLQSAPKRQIRLDPTVAIIDPTGPIKLGNSGLSEDEARRRGWGTVHRWSYQPTLAWLEETLNNPMRQGQLQGIWAQGDTKGKDAPRDPILGTDPSAYEAYGLHGRCEPITEQSDAFKSFVAYRYPVYAIGYNFLQSNEISAKEVLDGVDFVRKKGGKVTRQRIMGIREICRECNTDKAIVITHSMGGLVARMASQFCGGADDILGVIHGAQPATGAPVFGKRFRTGGEGFITQSLLGRNDAEFVAIAANAEGPMELSPMPDYHDGKPWWIFRDNSGKECMRLPQTDAFSELYTSDAWYGLLPDSSLLDPAGTVKKRLGEQGSPDTVYQNYIKTMDRVIARQRRLINNYHPNTYAMYGDGALKAPTPADKKAEALLTWGTVIWQGDLPDGTTEADLKAAQLIHDNHRGELTIVVRGQTVKLTVQKRGFKEKSPEPIPGIVPGDGTVPVWSAQAQGRGLLPDVWGSREKAQGVQMVFKHGGYDHQFCFDHPWTRWAVLYSVAQIVHSTKGVAACA